MLTQAWLWRNKSGFEDLSRVDAISPPLTVTTQLGPNLQTNKQAQGVDVDNYNNQQPTRSTKKIGLLIKCQFEDSITACTYMLLCVLPLVSPRLIHQLDTLKGV